MLVPALLLLLSQPPASSCAVADEPAFGTALTSAIQTLLDADGLARQIVYVGGPAALTAAAIDAVRGWTAEPARLNGTPIIAPVTFQVKFGSQ